MPYLNCSLNTVACVRKKILFPDTNQFDFLLVVGLTSPGGKLTDAAERTPVGIFCEGKEHAVCVGITTMSTDDIASKNKGIGVEVIHFLNDGLWCMDPSKIF